MNFDFEGLICGGGHSVVGDARVVTAIAAGDVREVQSGAVHGGHCEPRNGRVSLNLIIFLSGQNYRDNFWAGVRGVGGKGKDSLFIRNFNQLKTLRLIKNSQNFSP